MIEKRYISADELLLDSFELAFRVLDSGFRPTHIAGIWRGGTPVGIAVQELLAFAGIHTDHIAIRTSLYEGIAKPGSRVRVHGLSYLIKKLSADNRLLIVDDVYDSGRSMLQVIAELRERCRRNTPEIRIATVYRKPSTALPINVPHYFLHDTDRWLVFPHELDGLAIEEIIECKPGLGALRDRLLNITRGRRSDD
jgi:hypoxanthine phosphoribosyltransferase